MALQRNFLNKPRTQPKTSLCKYVSSFDSSELYVLGIFLTLISILAAAGKKLNLPIILPLRPFQTPLLNEDDPQYDQPNSCINLINLYFCRLIWVFQSSGKALEMKLCITMRFMELFEREISFNWPKLT